MKQLNKNNLTEFTEYYHSLHDSYITNINYDIEKSKIELLIDVYWSGEPTLKDDDTYETNKVKIRMLFNGTHECNIKEIFSWDYIYEAYIKYIKIDKKDFICFASDEDDPLIYIVCENIEYEELN